MMTQIGTKKKLKKQHDEVNGDDAARVREREEIEEENPAKRIRLNQINKRRITIKSINNVCKYANCKSLYSGIGKMINDLSEENEYDLGIGREKTWDCTKHMMKLMQVESQVIELFPHPHDDIDKYWNELYTNVEFIDDVNGNQYPDNAKVIEARKLEIGY